MPGTVLGPSLGATLGPAPGDRRARFVLTDRDGIRADADRPVRVDADPSTRVADVRAGGVRAGVSAPPYEHLDLALHVGDDPDHVRANRDALAAAVGARPGALWTMDQVHGSTVAVVEGTPDPSAPPVADALVTTEAGTRLVVQVADCVPVAIADPVAGVVGVVHAGRRGVAADVVARTVETMVRAGGGAARGLHAVVGPAVCAGCYEVPQELHDEVVAVVPGASGRSRAGTPALDLRAAVVDQLHAAGVAQAQVVGGCTAEDPTLYSYRRDGRTGRFALVVWWE